MKPAKSYPRTNAHMTRDDLQIEKVVTNILQKCKLEAERNDLQIPLDHVEDRVSYYTGIPLQKLIHLQLTENIFDPRKFYTIDYHTHVKVLKCLLQYYESKDFPRYSILYEDVRENQKKFPTFERFKDEVMRIGINYQKVHNNIKVLMEDPKLTFDRFLYLRKMKKIRLTREPVCYIGERLVDKNLDFKVPRYQNNIDVATTPRDEYTFFHAVSQDGYVDGMFCLHPTTQTFNTWVTDFLMPVLEPRCVIVMDRNPLHGVLKSKAISMLDTKIDMLKWLKKNDVPCSYAMNKCQLYEQIKKHTIVDEVYDIDRVFKSHGHEVLRLPRYFEYLSPLDLIWKNIKDNIVVRNELKSDVLSMFINTAKHHMLEYENRIQSRENELFKLDADIDNALDQYLLYLK